MSLLLRGNVLGYYQEFYRNIYSTAPSKIKRIFQKYMYGALTKNFSIDSRQNYLELGVGKGELSEYLNKEIPNYFGLDINFPDQNDYQNGLLKNRFIVGDIHSLPIKSNAIKNIYVTCVLHHLHNPLLGIREIKRIIHEDSNSIISILIPNDPSKFYRLLYMIFSAKKYKKLGIEDPWEHHLIQHLIRKDGLEYFILKVFNNNKIIIKKYPKFFHIFKIYHIYL